MAREAIRLQFGKYNGDEHWGFDAVVLGRDAQGLWLGVTGGTRVARPGLEFAAHGDFVVLVPDDAWWVATFNTAPGGKDHDIDVYVDITTPTTVKVTAAPSEFSPEGKETVVFDAKVRIDTPGEADYYRNGGILQYVLRSLV